MIGEKPMQRIIGMRHPFWIVNTSLFFLVLLALLFIYISRIRIPERESIEPVEVRPTKERRLDINIRKIYENDLFDTYKKELPGVKPIDLTIPFPEPPQPQDIKIPELPKPEFLDPLDITLKGIIVVGTNDAKNRAIIEDNKTKREDTYKVGNTIEDSQLIRIFRNKIIFLRTNGQQEVLYLREQDAKFDPTYALINGWDTVIQKVKDKNYIVSPTELTKRIKNLGQFIEMLSLTTAYKQGKSIGIRIGQFEEQSLGQALGLQKGDIILNINDIPATTTEERLNIYQAITALNQNDIITLKLLRRKQEKVTTYTLKDFATETASTEGEQLKETASISLLKQKEKEEILKQRYKFAPTIKEMHKQERRNMLEKGKASTE